MSQNMQIAVLSNETSEFIVTDKQIDINQRIRIDRFLASVQSSGYRMAQLATSNKDDALELVQESRARAL